MASLLLALAASVLLVQVFPSDAATSFMTQSMGGMGGMNQNMGKVTSGKVTWQIDVTAFFSYKSTAERDSQLKQILQLWKSSFDASSKLSNEKITLISESDVQGFAGYKQVSFRITGNSPAGVNVNSLVAQFTTILQNAHIAGVQTTLSSGGNSGSGSIGGGTVTVQIDVQADLQYTSSSQRDQILQQVLSLFQSTFGSQGFKNLKVSVVSETASANIPGGKTLSFRITGSAPGGVDMNSISQQFIQSLSTATIPGFTLSQQYQTGEITIPSGGGSTGTVTVQIDVQADLQYTSSSQRDQILQKVLSLFQSTFGSQGFKNLKVSVVSETASANIPGGKTLSFRITGSAPGGVDMNSISQQFIQSLSTATIPGFTLSQQYQTGEITIPSGGGTTTTTINWEIDINGVFQYANSAARDKIFQQIIALWSKNFGAKTGGFANPKVTVVSESAGPTSGTKQLHVKITGSSSSTVDIQSLIQSFVTLLQTSHIAGVVSISPDSGTGDNGGHVSGGGTGGTVIGGGKPFIFNGNLVITFKNDVELNKILQQILQLWITTYSSQWNVSPGAKITVVSKQDNGNGKWTITYKITGSSVTTPDTTDGGFNAVISGNQIGGVEIPDGDGNNGGGNSGTDGGGSSVTGGGNPFTFNGKLVITFKTQAELDKILQQILQLWITTYSSQLNVSPGAKITVVSKQNAGNGKWTITYKITGSSVTTPDTNDGGFNIVISGSQISGVEVPSGGGENGGGNSGTDGGGSSVSGGGNPFTFNGKLVITFKTQAELDKILQQILQLWITTYTTQWSISPGAKITVVSKQNAGGGKWTITYKITGTGCSGIDTTDANFNTIISGSGIIGVEVPSGGGSTGGGNTGGGSGGSFTIENTVVIKGNPGDVNGYLQKILTLWFQTFGSRYTISGQKIVQVSVSSVNPGWVTVTYRITGTSQQTIDADQNNNEFNQLIASGKITGVTLTVGGGDSAGGDNSGTGQYEISENQKNPIQIAAGSNFDVTLVVYLSHRNDAERTNFLDRLLVMWRNTLNDYQVTNLKLSFVREQKNVGKLSAEMGNLAVHKVWYRLTGGTVLAFNTAEVSKVFERTVIDSHLGGVEFVLHGSGSSAGGSGVSGGSVSGGGGQTPEGDGNNMLGGGGGAFRISGTVKLTYKTNQQRDTFLSQVMVMWRNAIWSYQVSNVKIDRTGESGSGPTKVVSYVITGTSALPIDLNEARNTFRTTLIDSHLTGVQYA